MRTSARTSHLGIVFQGRTLIQQRRQDNLGHLLHLILEINELGALQGNRLVRRNDPVQGGTKCSQCPVSRLLTIG
jgi:hypothetical protein